MPQTPLDPRRPWLLAASVALLAVLAWTFAATHDRLTWALETFPVWIALPLMATTQRRYPLTTLLYFFIFWHCVVLMVGGQYTYAKVPAGFWVQDALHLARNPYDRLGHLMQGFVPALLFREVLVRKGALRTGGWSVFVLLFMVLGLSAAYELLEWQTAVWTGTAADAFLGTQGDVWDTQWDMACAGLGAAASLALLSRLHDRQMLEFRNPGEPA